MEPNLYLGRFLRKARVIALNFVISAQNGWFKRIILCKVRGIYTVC